MNTSARTAKRSMPDAVSPSDLLCRKTETPLGTVYLVSCGSALTGLYFEAQRNFDARTLALPLGEDSVTQLAEDWLARYFAGEAPSASELPLFPQGSKFRQRVWQELLRIPYGSTVTYGELAAALGKPMSAQAVGGAVGHNPISLIIPCHRVVGKNGALTGYAGGLDRKAWLLAHETKTV